MNVLQGLQDAENMLFRAPGHTIRQLIEVCREQQRLIEDLQANVASHLDRYYNGPFVDSSRTVERTGVFTTADGAVLPGRHRA